MRIFYIQAAVAVNHYDRRRQTADHYKLLYTWHGHKFNF